MVIKQVIGFIFIMLTLGCAAQAEGFPVDEDGFTTGVMDYRGHTIYLDALVDDTFSLPLQSVKIVSAGLTQKQIMRAAEQCFEVAPQRKIFMIGATFRFGQGEDSVSAYELPFRQEYPVTDPVLQERLQECYRFCDLLNIAYATVPAHAIYYRRDESHRMYEISPEEAKVTDNVYIAIKIPIVIEGMPIAFEHVGHRGNEKVSADNVIIDYPWVSMAFDSEGRFISAMFSFYRVADTQPLAGALLPWVDAIEPALDEAFHVYMNKPRTVEEFFDEFDLHITRVQAVWFPSWSAVLRPGYYVSFEVYDKATGEFVSPLSDRYWMQTHYGVEAVIP